MLLLKSGILEVEDDEESQLAAQDADHKSFNPQLDSEVELQFRSYSILITSFIELSLFSFKTYLSF